MSYAPNGSNRNRRRRRRRISVNYILIGFHYKSVAELFAAFHSTGDDIK
jgi:hypothetical protein